MRPFENHAFSAHFVFSYGHLLLNAGYESNKHQLYIGEEPYQRYKAWKAGYTMYTPSKFIIWHLWDRSYRHEFEEDFAIEREDEKKQKFLVQASFVEEVLKKRLRRIMYADKEYRREQHEKFGIDLLGRQGIQVPGTHYGASIDPDFFRMMTPKEYEE